jgi:hypothetical protein
MVSTCFYYSSSLSRSLALFRSLFVSVKRYGLMRFSRLDYGEKSTTTREYDINPSLLDIYRTFHRL